VVPKTVPISHVEVTREEAVCRLNNRVSTLLEWIQTSHRHSNIRLRAVVR
jgi:hypothetical protein